jgi:hypothetical protein
MTTEQPPAGPRQAPGPKPDGDTTGMDARETPEPGVEASGSPTSDTAAPGSPTSRTAAPGSAMSDVEAPPTPGSGVDRPRLRRWAGLRRSRSERTPETPDAGRKLRPAIPPPTTGETPGTTPAKPAAADSAATPANAPRGAGASVQPTSGSAPTEPLEPIRSHAPSPGPDANPAEPATASTGFDAKSAEPAAATIGPDADLAGPATTRVEPTVDTAGSIAKTSELAATPAAGEGKPSARRGARHAKRGRRFKGDTESTGPGRTASEFDASGAQAAETHADRAGPANNLAGTGTAPATATGAASKPAKTEASLAETAAMNAVTGTTAEAAALTGAAGLTTTDGAAATWTPGTDGTPGAAGTAGAEGTAGAAAATPGKPADAGAEPSTGRAPAPADGEAEPSTGQTPAPGGSRFRRNRKTALPTTRPPGAPPDPWTAFAETPVERAPGRARRVARRTGRALRHEYALVIYGALLLAVVLTWPTLRYPLHTVPQDVWDPSRQAWQVAWAGHVLLTEPARLWQANAFFPEHYSFAFGDSLLGYAPLAMLGHGPLAAVLRYNILFVLAHALLAVGGYALVRQLGAGRTGAVVGAVAFAYAPWRLAQEGHLDIVSAGGIPLALAMLARGHGYSLRYGFRPSRRRTGWAVAGWIVATWQLSLGFSLGLPFAYVLGALIVVVAVVMLVRQLRRRGQGAVLGWRLLVTDLLGSLIFVGVGALIALPYFRVPATTPAGTEIAFFSPPVRSLLIGPAESRIWGAPHAVARAALAWPAEMSLLPGFVLYALALAGLLFSVWRVWQRLVLLAGAVVSAIVMLGTTFFEGRWTYLPLFGHLPASFGVRVPGRLMLWVTLFLAILAAGAVAEFVRRAEGLAAARTQPWPGPWLRLATFVPLLLVLAEGWNATAHPVVPDQPAAMRTVQGPMLVLPTATLTDQTVMLWSTSKFQQMANGSGGFAPQRQSELRRSVAAFPDAASVQYLRSLGIGTVLLLRSEVTGTPWERAGDIPVDTLGITREDLDDNSVLFRLG